MRRLLWLLPALALLAGCGPITVTVYGKSGTPYVAPTLCAAMLACQNSGRESACYYEKDSYAFADGTHATSAKCVAVPVERKP